MKHLRKFNENNTDDIFDYLFIIFPIDVIKYVM